jgi:hypothetical protein
MIPERACGWLPSTRLQGRFGAVPEFDQFALRRAMGLAQADA